LNELSSKIRIGDCFLRIEHNDCFLIDLHCIIIPQALDIELVVLQHVQVELSHVLNKEFWYLPHDLWNRIISKLFILKVAPFLQKLKLDLKEVEDISCELLSGQENLIDDSKCSHLDSDCFHVRSMLVLWAHVLQLLLYICKLVINFFKSLEDWTQKSLNCIAEDEVVLSDCAILKCGLRVTVLECRLFFFFHSMLFVAERCVFLKADSCSISDVG
jgi:hypothetical protein